MKKFAALALVLGVPLSLSAGLNIDVRVNGTGHVYRDYNENNYYEEEYVDDGEPWFEDEVCDGPIRVSLEYQWSLVGPLHILRYRKVSFNPWTNQWSFGVWMVRDHICHSSCTMHHAHVYFRPKNIAPFWMRQCHRDGGKVSYYYEYKNHDRHHSGAPQVYRYEYKPEINIHRDRGIPEGHAKRHYEFNEREYNNNNHRGEELYRRNSQQYNSDNRYNRENKNSSDRNGISKVSGRERIR